MHNMKKQLTKLSTLQATLLLSGITSLVLLGLSALGFIAKQPGWMIGVAIGGVISLAYIFLTDVSSKATLKESKAGLFILCYFVKMILFVGFFAMLVVFQYTLHLSVFDNSFWGMLIGFFPTLIITIAVQLTNKGGNDGQVL